MKIVRIIARLNVGGPARHVVWLTKELNYDKEFQSVLLAGTVPEGEEDMSYFASEHGVVPIFIPEMSRELSPRDIVSLWKVYRRIVKEKPDIVHTHTAKAGTIGRAAAFLYRFLNWKKIIIVHTFHGHIFHSYYGSLKTKFFLLIEKILARLATDKIIVISRQQYEEIHRRFGVGRVGQFAVVPLGIDLQPFQNSFERRAILREEIGAGEDEILVGFVGRLTEIKNVPLLLRVAEIYLKQREQEEQKGECLPKLKFLIVGDGNLRAELERESEKLGLLETVKFLGNRNDADVFYAGLDIVALTSLNEGTPLSLIEAMANEKPVISTAVGGVIDLLGAVEREIDGFEICERGVRVPSGEPEAFAKGLIYLAKNEKLRRDFETRGLEYVVSNYSKERLITDVKKLYRDLIEESVQS